jgi:three-Cys-motif partner protein
MDKTSNAGGEWGGAWTEKKLDAFAKYVWSYLTILKKNPKRKTIYFDGFAGSGDRKGKKNDPDAQKSIDLDDGESSSYRGAAERVLTLKDDLLFDYYYFVDKPDPLKKLEEKLKKLPSSENTKLVFRAEDCNKTIKDLAAALKKDGNLAALILLDPFGMQINWNSIAELKGTSSDIWILVPTGVIVNRLLFKSGELPYSDKLQSFFGLSEDEIKNEFYRTEQTTTLFGNEDTTIKKITKPINHIMNLYIRQLKTIWPHVTDPALRLDNKGRPLFHFVFASNHSVALKIAKEIIKVK